MNPADFAGDRNRLGLTSPSPIALPEMSGWPGSSGLRGNSEGWLMIGTIVRVIRFYSGLKWIGITGCTLST